MQIHRTIVASLYLILFVRCGANLCKLCSKKYSVLMQTRRTSVANFFFRGCNFIFKMSKFLEVLSQFSSPSDANTHKDCSIIFVGLFKLSMAAPTAIAGVDAAIRSRRCYQPTTVTPRFAVVLLQGGVDVVSLDRRLLRRGDLAATCSSSPVSHGATPVAHPYIERLH